MVNVKGLFFAAFATALLVGCGNNPKSDINEGTAQFKSVIPTSVSPEVLPIFPRDPFVSPGTRPKQPTSSLAIKGEIDKVRFFSGGGYPRPGFPNFSADLLIDFTSSGLKLTARHENSLCTKSGSLLVSHQVQLDRIIKNLQLSIKNSGSFRIDAGVTTLEVTLANGKTIKVHLSPDDANYGEIIAANAEKLADSLHALDDSLEVTCKGVIKAKDILEARYFVGGGHPAPGKPNWSIDMNIKFTSSGLEIEGRHTDKLCRRAMTLLPTHRDQLARLISELKFSPSTGPTRVDAGVKTLTVTLKKGKPVTLHFSKPDAPKGAFVVTNGDKFASSVKTLFDALPVFCQ